MVDNPATITEQIRAQARMIQKEALWNHVKKFLKDHDITVSETIYQMDSVSLDSLEFIEGCFEIVGTDSDDV